MRKGTFLSIGILITILTIVFLCCQSEDESPSDIIVSALPNRPWFGTEIYNILGMKADELLFVEELGIDFTRIGVTPYWREGREYGQNDDDDPFTDFTTFSAEDMESPSLSGWNMKPLSDRFDRFLERGFQPIVTVIHRSESEAYFDASHHIGKGPLTGIHLDEYGEFFLAHVYYLNVLKEYECHYWEILNEPNNGSWIDTAGYFNASEYAAVVSAVGQRIRNFPDSRVNSIVLGGATVGSGGPIDGSFDDGGFQYRDYFEYGDYYATMLNQADNDIRNYVDMITYHLYGGPVTNSPYPNGSIVSNSIYPLHLDLEALSIYYIKVQHDEE